MASVIEVLEAPQWSWPLRVGFAAGVLGGLELLSLLTMTIFGHADRIPVKGKHHDTLTPWDLACISFNKMTVVMFSWHIIAFAWHSPRVDFALDALTPSNFVLAVPLLYVVYDFFYTLFHRFLHIKAVYTYVHKHHHIQKAPSRGNTDAVNVHPFEFIVGEYNHLLALWLVTSFMRVHVAAVAVFIVAGGVLASLNHTRFDVQVPGMYDVKHHDVHHRIPQSNYGQYIMLWDRLMGSFREYAR